MGLLQPGHLILLLVIALVIVGPGKIAGLGGALGSSIRDFRKAVDNEGEPVEPAVTAAKPLPVAPLAPVTPTTVLASAEAEDARTITKDA